MTKLNVVALAIVYTNDLSEQGFTKENITMADFKPEVITACEDADIVIYEDEASIRKVIVYNDELDERSSPSYEVLAEQGDNCSNDDDEPLDITGSM